MRALCRQSALTSPIALRLGPLLSRFAGEDNERERLLLRSGRRKGPVLRSKAKQDGIDEGPLSAKRSLYPAARVKPWLAAISSRV